MAATAGVWASASTAGPSCRPKLRTTWTGPRNAGRVPCRVFHLSPRAIAAFLAAQHGRGARRHNKAADKEAAAADKEAADAQTQREPSRTSKLPEREVMGWANWPPTSLQQVMNLYGGTRRFLIVNVPLLFVGLGANLLGSFSALLSLDVFTPLVAALRLDGVYAVRGLKRHYIDGLTCTFTYPGDWVYDPALEISRYRRQEKALSLGGTRNAGAPLPLVAVKPQDSSDMNVALYAVPATGPTLSRAVGSPEQAQSTAGAVALGYLPARRGKEAKAELVSATSVESERESYELQWRVIYADVNKPDESTDMSWDVWATLQLTTPPGGKSYVLVLAGVARTSADESQRVLARAAARSLAALTS